MSNQLWSEILCVQLHSVNRKKHTVNSFVLYFKKNYNTNVDYYVILNRFSFSSLTYAYDFYNLPNKFPSSMQIVTAAVAMLHNATYVTHKYKLNIMGQHFTGILNLSGYSFIICIYLLQNF
jgi:hypothetical protein